MKKWQILLFLVSLLLLSTMTFSCKTDSKKKTSNESESGSAGDDWATISLDSEGGESHDEMTVVYKEGSRTWPVAFVGIGANGDRYRSFTNRRIGPWIGHPVNFKGLSSGGNKLIYRYKLQFDEKVEINSIEIEGAGWGEVRLLDRRKKEVVKYNLPGGSEFHRYTIHTFGSSGTVFYLEESEERTNEFRYRSDIQVNASPECAGEADIVLNGNDYISTSDMVEGAGQRWFEGNNSLFTLWDLYASGNPLWVEYEVFLTKGDWRIGLCAINHSIFGEPGIDPDAYGSFQIVNSLTNEAFEVPASDTRIKSGSFPFTVRQDGTYSVRFTWQNDDVVVDDKTGTVISDANLKIVRVFFDALEEEDDEKAFNWCDLWEKYDRDDDDDDD